jgi:tripartite-type tricarboxylate transporter receptor subunit TctC
MKRRHFAALAGAALAAPAVLAQDRTIRILGRLPARRLGRRHRAPAGAEDAASLNQNVIVDNKPGAAGRLVLGELKRMPPDGQNLVLSPSGAMVIAPWLYSNIGYDPVKDFTPVSRIVTFDFAVTAGPGAPQGDLKTVLAWMKANPGKANYGTSGAGTVPHFAGLLLGQASGVPLTHVAYRGGAPAAQDLIGGQIPLMVDTASETIEHHKAGKVRILAVTGEQRSKSLPDVPTLKEQGINMAADAFFGLYGPPGMPADVTARIDRAVADALKDPGRAGKDLRLRPGAQPCAGGGPGGHAGGAPEALGDADQGVRLQGRVASAERPQEGRHRPADRGQPAPHRAGHLAHGGARAHALAPGQQARHVGRERRALPLAEQRGHVEGDVGIAIAAGQPLAVGQQGIHLEGSTAALLRSRRARSAPSGWPAGPSAGPRAGSTPRPTSAPAASHGRGRACPWATARAAAAGLPGIRRSAWNRTRRGRRPPAPAPASWD